MSPSEGARTRVKLDFELWSTWGCAHYLCCHLLFLLLWLLLLARLINRQDVVFDEYRKFGNFGCRQCR